MLAPSRRFGNVVEFPLQHLVVTVESITYLSFRFPCGKYFALEVFTVIMTSVSFKSKLFAEFALIQFFDILQSWSTRLYFLNLLPKKRAMDAFPQTPTSAQNTFGEVFKTNPVRSLFDCQASRGHSDDLSACHAFLFTRLHYL